jgi:hypothetical protein
MAGIGSAASRAAQSGATAFVTSDAAGNLALADFGPGDIGRLDSAMRIDRRDARDGIAAAAALGYAPMPSEPGRTAWALNGSTFRGEQAVGGSLAHRFAADVPVTVTAGFAYGGHDNNLVRIGLAGEFGALRLRK